MAKTKTVQKTVYMWHSGLKGQETLTIPIGKNEQETENLVFTPVCEIL